MTVPRRNRQAGVQRRREKALKLVQQRIDFWTSKLDDNIVIVDGKECDPEEKLLQATYEENRLNSKLQFQ